VAMFARALDRGEQPAYAVAGLLDDFNAAQIATLQGMVPPSTDEEPGRGQDGSFEGAGRAKRPRPRPLSSWERARVRA
jgi:hypothetical protein